jgi:long-subunit acyl-CoA synthetase (AMP-forming)
MTIIYTSGTTGNPKGVVHTFFNFAWAIETGKKSFGLVDGQDRLFSYLPLSHIAERMLIEQAGIYCNSEIWFAESLDTFVPNLAEAQPTIFLAVPRIWTKFQMGILAKLPQKKLDLLLIYTHHQRAYQSQGAKRTGAQQLQTLHYGCSTHFAHAGQLVGQAGRGYRGSVWHDRELRHIAREQTTAIQNRHTGHSVSGGGSQVFGGR